MNQSVIEVEIWFMGQVPRPTLTLLAGEELQAALLVVPQKEFRKNVYPPTYFKIDIHKVNIRSTKDVLSRISTLYEGKPTPAPRNL